MKPLRSYDFSELSQPPKPASPSAKKKKSSEAILTRDTWGRIRRELFWSVGPERALGVLTRSGYSAGVRDSISGSPQSAIKHLCTLSTRSVQDKDLFVFDSTDSVEAQEQLKYFGGSKASQCAIVSGYLTGYYSTVQGRGIYFIELSCLGRGDKRCRFVGRLRDTWTAEHDLALAMYEEDNVSLELTTTREQLRLTKDRYQNLFEQSGQAIFILDPETSFILDANVAAEQITGFSKDELMKLNLFDITHTKDHHKLAEHIKVATSGQTPPEEERTLVHRDGQVRIVAMISKSLTYGGQSVIQSVLRDVTDLKVVEQSERDLQNQLSRSERLSSIGRLAAGVAHEIKNPLGAIKNAIYYIRNSLQNNPVMETDPQLKVIMKLAEDEVDGAVMIIEELLDFSRVVELVPRRTQVNELLEQLPAILKVPDNVRIDFDLDIALPSATLDPDRLRQVFANIANNAIQAMSQGGTLTVRSRLEIQASEESTAQELLTISFQDTGIGIPAHHLKKIFEPLFTTKVRGTGLGLAITNNIVEKHGGTIVVVSQVGKGTTFSVKLPLRGSSSSEAKK